MPNKPARMPVTKPATMIRPARNKSSLTGTPKIMVESRLDIRFRGARSRRRGVRHLAVGVHDQGQRRAEGSNAGARLDGLGGKVAAEGARARDAAEQAENVPRDRVQPGAAEKFALEVRH